jgi:hypothetical protein
MADATVSRLGQVDKAGDALALFLKVFSGMTLAAFNRATDYRGRHVLRVIDSGKTAQFPVMGRATGAYHTPGAEITGGQLAHGEEVIAIDGQLIYPLFIANIDEAMNHYPVRDEYSTQIGQGLAKQYDKDISRSVTLAARGAGTGGLAELSGGSTVNDVDFDTDGVKLFNAIFDAGTTLDTKDVPAMDRQAYLKPTQYALVVRSEKPIDRDLNPQSNGSLAEGFVNRVNAIELVKTNNMAQENDSANAAVPASRQADYSVTQAQVAHRSAAGTVQLAGMAMESEYDIRRQGWLMIGKNIVGHGPLRDEAAVELRTADPA